MQTNTTSWRVPPLAWVPIGAAITAESVSNALRAYGLGTHLDRFTVQAYGQPVSIAGAVLVLAAIAVSLSQARAAWVALTPGATRQRIVSGLAALLLLTISVTAMASHILEAQRAKTSDESGARGLYDRTKAAHDKAAGELSRIDQARGIAEVRAAMDAAPVSRDVFRRTAECTAVTREDSFTACKPILDLRQEMGRAIRRAELEPEAKRLAGVLSGLARPEEARADETLVSGVWAWIMGLGLVFVATFGTVIFARVETGTGSTEPEPRGRDRVPVSVPAQRQVPRLVASQAAVSAQRPVPRPVSMELETPRVPDDSMLAWVRRFHSEQGRRPQIPELQRAFPGTPKTTAWRRCKAA